MNRVLSYGDIEQKLFSNCASGHELNSGSDRYALALSDSQLAVCVSGIIWRYSSRILSFAQEPASLLWTQLLHVDDSNSHFSFKRGSCAALSMTNPNSVAAPPRNL